MAEWIVLIFAGGEQYQVHIKELMLPRIAGTPLYKLLNEAHLYNQQFDQPRFIARYAYAFEVFMHCVRGYRVNLSYLQSLFREGAGPNMPAFIQILRTDNEKYGISAMADALDDMCYLHFPHLMPPVDWAAAYMRQTSTYQAQHSRLYVQIDNYIEEHDLENVEKPDRYTPMQLLEKQLSTLRQTTEMEDFADDMNSRLPYIIIGMMEAISSVIDKPLAANYKENIKMRIRSDPGLMRELHDNLQKANVLHIMQLCMSCLTLFAFE